MLFVIKKVGEEKTKTKKKLQKEQYHPRYTLILDRSPMDDCNWPFTTELETKIKPL